MTYEFLVLVNAHVIATFKLDWELGRKFNTFVLVSVAYWLLLSPYQVQHVPVIMLPSYRAVQEVLFHYHQDRETSNTRNEGSRTLEPLVSSILFVESCSETGKPYCFAPPSSMCITQSICSQQLARSISALNRYTLEAKQVVLVRPSIWRQIKWR